MRITLKRWLILFFIPAALAFSCNTNAPASASELRPDTLHLSKAHLSSTDSIQLLLNSKNNKLIAKQLDSLFSYKFKNKGFNGNVLIARDGLILYKKAWGVKDFKTKDPLDLGSAFQLGSSSKPLTALAVIILKERGLLNYDQTVNDFFPAFPYKGVTIRQLLTHRSGLPNYMYFCDQLYCCQDVPLTNDKLLDLMIEKHPPKYYPPNKKFEYCNTNYSLLVNIIEKVSKKKFGQFMHDEVFAPLQMNHTWVCQADSNKAHKNKTIGHKANRQHYYDDYLDGIQGDKNIFTTVDDLFLFDQALYHGKLISDSSLQLAYTGASHEHNGKRNYGFGWRMVDEPNGEKLIYHNGWWHGYNNVFFRRINDKTTIIILSNKITAGVYNTEDVIAILDGSKGGDVIDDNDN